MRTVALRGLRAHKGRFFLTLLSVVLGTAFVAGSFVLTDTLRASFNGIVDGSLGLVDVEVAPVGEASAGLPLSLVDDLKKVDGVYAVEPAASANVSILDADGKALASGGAPIQGGAWLAGRDAASSEATIVQGRAPRADDEIVLNVTAAEKAGLEVGDTTQVLLPKEGLVPVTLVGLYELDFNVGGFVGVFFTKQKALEAFTDGERVPSIYLRAEPGSGVTQQQLKDRVVAAGLPVDVQARTGDVVRDEAKGQIGQALNFVTTFFLVFALIALLVGSFIIANTFAMVVAQRLRELALLRALGASRRQVTRSVLVEGLLVGLVGSLIGLASGFALALGLLFLINNVFGAAIPVGNLSVTPIGVVATLSVGILVTLAAAYGPARRAGHTSPVEAMRGEFATPKPSIKRRLVPALVLLGIGAGLTAVAVAQDSLQMLGGGFVVVLIALLMLSPFAAPIIMSIFRPLTRWRPMGRLAQGNANRNPKRTAATAFALALGLALISCFALIGASLRETFTGVLENGQNWTYIVSNAQNGPVAPNVIAAVQDTKGVASTVQLGFTSVSTEDAPGERLFTLGLGGKVSDAFTLDMVAGDGELTPDTFLVTDTEAAKRGWAMGDSVTFTAPGAPPATLRVGGIMAAGQFLDPMVVPLEVSQTLAPPELREPSQVLVATTPGADDAALRAAFGEATKNYPLVTYQDREEYAQGANAQINTILYIMYGMLALAIVISILGIVNTLGLSVVERRREVGMLRAVGTSRRQVRRMITIESILIASYGAIIGITLGLVYGWLFVGRLKDDGFTSRVVPWGQFAIFVVIAVIVGALAALWPAIKASRTKPLEALAED